MGKICSQTRPNLKNLKTSKTSISGHESANLRDHYQKGLPNNQSPFLKDESQLNKALFKSMKFQKRLKAEL